MLKLFPTRVTRLLDTGLSPLLFVVRLADQLSSTRDEFVSFSVANLRDGNSARVALSAAISQERALQSGNVYPIAMHCVTRLSEAGVTV